MGRCRLVRGGVMVSVGSKVCSSVGRLCVHFKAFDGSRGGNGRVVVTQVFFGRGGRGGKGKISLLLGLYRVTRGFSCGVVQFRTPGGGYESFYGELKFSSDYSVDETSLVFGLRSCLFGGSTRGCLFWYLLASCLAFLVGCSG